MNVKFNTRHNFSLKYLHALSKLAIAEKIELRSPSIRVRHGDIYR